ncbi:MAG: hypothetical protein ACP6IY_01840 [Promethearchaeia archaeon]
MSEEKLFEIFLHNLKFDITEYLELKSDADLNDFQKKAIESATEIIKGNIIGEVKKFGGNYKKNEQKFKKFEKKAEEELMQEKYKSIKKDLKDFLKDYIKNLRKLIEATCMAIIPVKEMPWADVIFRTVPRIDIIKKKCSFYDNAIVFYGEINCLISRTTIFGKMKGVEPLFAPYMGPLDLDGYKLDESEQKGSKALIYPYVSAIIRSLDNTLTRSQLAKYQEGYQRHGEPICDFLMKDGDLMKSMEKITTGIDSKRVLGDIAVAGIAIPHPEDKKTLIILTDESSDDDKYIKCFEAFLKFSAACCEAPSTKREGAGQPIQATQPAPGATTSGTPPTQVPASATQQPIPGGTIRTPGGQELQVWTPEELAQATQQRGTGIPSNMEVWTEEELEKFAAERGSGIPEGMEVWTEEELEELKKQRQGGGLDIPEWKPDESLPECQKCGYTLRKGWTECPICNTPIGVQIESKEKQEQKEPQPQESKEEKINNSEEKKEKSAQKSEDNKDS